MKEKMSEKTESKKRPTYGSGTKTISIYHFEMN